MHKMLTILIAVLPLTILGRYVGGKYISPSLVFAVAIAFITILALLLHQYKIYKSQVKWLAPYGVFVVIGIISIISSPYVHQAWIKGTTQIIGILIMLIMSIAIGNEIKRQPAFFLKLLRVSLITLGVIGGIGVVQFISFNLFSYDKFFNFLFMNNIAGGSVWRNPGQIGIIHRANSIASEPARFTQFIGFGAGIALIRVGFLGKTYKRSIARIVPSWAAWLILLGFMVSISMVGYLLLIMIAAFLWFVSSKVCLKTTILMTISILFLSGAIFFVTQYTGRHFIDKVATLRLLVSASSEGVETVSGNELSALALASNIEVMLGNLSNNPLFGAGLGAHPAAYEELAPSYVYNKGFLPGLNAQGGASLLIRLLSETGILGTSLFIAGFLVVFARGRQAILWASNKQAKGGTVSCSPSIPLAIGITASCAGVFLIYLARLPLYYDPQLWILMALTACLPQVLESYKRVLPSFGYGGLINQELLKLSAL